LGGSNEPKCLVALALVGESMCGGLVNTMVGDLDDKLNHKG